MIGVVACRISNVRRSPFSSRSIYLCAPIKASADQVPAHQVADALHSLAATDALDHAASSVSSIYAYLLGRHNAFLRMPDQRSTACFVHEVHDA